MFRQPGHIENASLRLSEVLSDIGVNERIVLKRRRSCLLIESLLTRQLQLGIQESSVNLLGSQSEGTTTLGLNSDSDVLVCNRSVNVIQDRSDWKPGVTNFLMIQDETVSPGYCLLQGLRDDTPLRDNNAANEHFVRDRSGRILLKNKIISATAEISLEAGVRSGPAYTQRGSFEVDQVGSFHCQTWPVQAKPLLGEQGEGQGLSDEVRRYCRGTGCFVVGVGSKGSENEELEWRVSTSLAERCLMFNLNITQIRCYVLMKMILKTFLKQPQFNNIISSFMCKTVLFHCISITHVEILKENQLLHCLSICLCVLYKCISNENCPHFIIPGTNLMQGKIPPELKPYILEILQNIVESEGRALFEIECDALGARFNLMLARGFSIITNDIVSGHLLLFIAKTLENTADTYLKSICNQHSTESVKQILCQYIVELIDSKQRHGLDETVFCLLAPRLCAVLGSILASESIQQHNAIPAAALNWISMGLNTDVASSKLKLASMLYCIGDVRKTEIALRNIEGNYDLNIAMPVCASYRFEQRRREGFETVCDRHNEEAIQFGTASCVKFLPCEINCVPPELQYEMFRSTQEDLAFRDENDYWMDWAVVDSLSYLYFLQYKTFNSNLRLHEKQMALSNLLRTILEEPELGHRETAFNLLGQCMEQEDRVTDALRCYVLSLRQRERNNAAKIHICRLLSTVIRNQ